jgi:hypothetical protein
MKISSILLKNIALAIGVGTIVACNSPKKLPKKTETANTKKEKTEKIIPKNSPDYCPGCGMG